MTDQPDPARSFGDVAAAYDRARPGYPPEAAAWLVGPQPVTVLELGAGTGKLTEGLLGLGHDVHATDPDEQMLEVLRGRLPDVRTSIATAEDIPAADAAYDVVVTAQAFHWFDHDRALPEIARVLKPGGRLAVVRNDRDERIPWVRRLGKIIGTNIESSPEDILVQTPLFGFVEDATFKFWQTVDRESIQDLVLSRSNVATLDEAGRAAKLAEVLAFYDDYGRGMDGMQLPYQTHCYRTAVIERPGADHADTDRPGPDVTDSPDLPVSDDGGDVDVLLIDFR
jgi:ubiquinone/menaquinone biosynthesis C-methylase UbiE